MAKKKYDKNKKKEAADIVLDLTIQLAKEGRKLMNSALEDRLQQALPILQVTTNALKSVQKFEDSSVDIDLDDDDEEEDEEEEETMTLEKATKLLKKKAKEIEEDD